MVLPLNIGVIYIHPLVMTNIAMDRSTIFKNGKPSISMGHLYHGKLLVITREYILEGLYTFSEHVFRLTV